MARDGKLIEAKISQSSGVARLDEAALQMVREFEQLPKPSSDMLGDPVVLQLPIDFRTE
ncbi:energy transducer TonB [Ochrobactrum cytisi]|nr:energy transducer TonB [Brucella cytisi]